MAQEPNWLKVIRTWCAQPGRTGPTFPFVFGAIRSPAGSAVVDEARAHEEFELLIAGMKTYQHDSEYLAVHQCGVIKQPVITIQRKQQPKAGPWADLFRDVDSLHISLPPFTSAEAESELWRRSRDAIVAGRYSFDGREFVPFDDAALALIAMALANASPGELDGKRNAGSGAVELRALGSTLIA